MTYRSESTLFSNPSAVLPNIDPATPVREVMTAPVHVILEDDYLYHGVAEMRRRKLRHMPVVSRRGGVVGVLNLHEALTTAAGQIVDQIDRLSHGANRDGLLATQRQTIDRFDRQYVPQVAYTTGDIDAHDIAVDADGRPVFVSTLFSCLATNSDSPLWLPLGKRERRGRCRD